jgi:alanyl-tRNA synthetase
LGLPKDRLYASVFGGDEKEGLASDEEARGFWLQYLPPNQILDGSKKDNFWEMGAQGPCGPCSEIHYDFRSDEERAKVPGETLVNQDDPQVVEIWNNVFMQFERKADGSLVVLPSQHVDTGMGFERLCMVMQNKLYTYDTDVFTPLIALIEEKSRKKYTGSYERTAMTDVAMRVVADHIRAVAFTIADGQLPSSGGAGYVIRRILRRAVRYSYSFLDIKEPFFNSLVPLLASEFKDVFPELKAQEAFVQKVILEEEKSFLRTLETGLKRLDILVKDLSPLGRLRGDDAFELLDTYGFPIDLTELIAKEKGYSVDNEGFKAALAAQKKRSQTDAAKQVGDWTDLLGEGENRVEFVGYEQLKVENAKVIKYRSVTDKKGLQYQIVLNRTPFYAESGGQVGDSGAMYFDGEKIAVLDTKKENDLIIHIVEKLPENINDERVRAQVDVKRRSLISKNHSVGHLLHAALHQVLGKHALQKGQSIDEHRLRFDFAHFNQVSKEELSQIESIVNQKIRENISLEEVREMPIADAQKTGAIMLFGEKYGETVRVITYDKDFSIELCGGTHVAATGEIGLCKIVSEGSVTAGVRRVEVLTADASEAYYNAKLEELNAIRTLLKNPQDLLKRLQGIQEDVDKKQKEIEKILTQKAAEYKESILENDLQEIDNKSINFIASKVEIDNFAIVKNLSQQLEQLLGNAVVLLYNTINDVTQISLRVSDSLVKDRSIKAGVVMNNSNPNIKGGGQPNYAEGRGIIAENDIESIIEKVKEQVSKSKQPLVNKEVKTPNLYYPNSEFTKKLFKDYVLNDIENHVKSPSWVYFEEKSKDYIRTKILKQGQADFTQPYTENGFELKTYDLVDLYCYYYMQMHYTSSLYLYGKVGTKFFSENLFQNKNLLFLDLGCGPFSSGAAFMRSHKKENPNTDLEMAYIGMDTSEEMLEKAKSIAFGMDDTNGKSTFEFSNNWVEIYQMAEQFKTRNKTYEKNSIIINLCYVLASPWFDDETNLNSFAKEINDIIKLFKDDSICFVYQNPNFSRLHNNWKRLKSKIENFNNLVQRYGVIEFSFDDETGSWKPYSKPSNRTTYIDIFYNENV